MAFKKKADQEPKEPKEPKEQKPYILDSGITFDTCRQKAGLGFAMVATAIILGFLAGFIIWAAFLASMFLTDLLWVEGVGTLQTALENAGLGSWWLPLVVTTIGGLIIGLWTKYTGAMPIPMEEVMANVKKSGRFAFRRPFATIVGFLLPLVFGGTIGPEAGLSGLSAHACTVIGGALRRRGIVSKGIADVSVSAAFAGLFANPLVGIAVSTTDAMPEDDLKNSDGAFDPYTYDIKKRTKIFLYAVSAIAAYFGTSAFSALTGLSAGFPRFDGIVPGGGDLLWAVPCVLLGYLGALLYQTSKFSFIKLSEKWSDRVVFKPVLCGIIIGVMAIFCPMVLFPGEEQLFDLIEEWQTWTVVLLLATGLLKCISAPMCLNMGWAGGGIFPLIYSGAALGYAMAMISGLDPMFCVALCTATLIAGTQRKMAISLAFMLLAFPPATIAFSLLAIAIGVLAPMPKAFFPDAKPLKNPFKRNDKTAELVEAEKAEEEAIKEEAAQEA